MLHNYNYSNSLSRLLGYNHLEDPNGNDGDHTMSTICEDSSQEDESRCRSASSVTNKSFTIAAILGLKNNDNGNICSSPADLRVVNLSVHPNLNDHSPLLTNCTRLQIPLHCHGANVPPGHYSVTSRGCSPSKQSVRGGKHGPSNITQNKKSCKSKRVRTIFTPEQLERLEAEFERQQYMVGPERLYLAHTLQLTEAQVKVWFQNRRIKWRKHHLELTHQRLAVLKQQQMLLDESHPDAQDTNSSSTDT